jgi:hypothetical protein
MCLCKNVSFLKPPCLRSVDESTFISLAQEPPLAYITKKDVGWNKEVVSPKKESSVLQAVDDVLEDVKATKE